MTQPRSRLRAVALLAGTAVLTLGLPACRSSAPPSLLLITIDTLRADHVSAYGYPWPTSPTLDALAADGVYFDRMFSPLPETAPSCASLLTGRWPAQLEMRGNGDPLDGRFKTLARLLQDAGYDTAAFVSGYPLIRRLSALDRGFDLYDDNMPDARGQTPGVQRSAEKTTAVALAWLRGRRSQPFFAWVHYYDPHGDYAPGPAHEALFADRSPGLTVPLASVPRYQQRGDETDAAVFIGRYDGEIRRVDDQIARLLEQLEDAGQRENTLVVITADHGESLTEHGYFFDHGNELYLPSARVPFILSGPGVPRRAEPVEGITRTVDILPTLLALLDRPAIPDLPGRSLVSHWQAGASIDRREALMEARFKPYRSLAAGVDVGPKLAVRDDRFTVILRLATARLELYDRLDDPDEHRDRAAALAATREGEPLLRRLEINLRRLLAAAAQGETPEPSVFDTDLRRQLEMLLASGAVE